MPRPEPRPEPMPRPEPEPMPMPEPDPPPRPRPRRRRLRLLRPRLRLRVRRRHVLPHRFYPPHGRRRVHELREVVLEQLREAVLGLRGRIARSDVAHGACRLEAPREPAAAIAAGRELRGVERLACQRARRRSAPWSARGSRRTRAPARARASRGPGARRALLGGEVANPCAGRRVPGGGGNCGFGGGGFGFGGGCGTVVRPRLRARRGLICTVPPNALLRGAAIANEHERF